jgi:DNA replicative helicase MCM subunit Mcm2 (Cdc46/Mcm family)
MCPDALCRQYHLNALVRLTGVVTRRTGVFPQLQRVRTQGISEPMRL